MKKLTIYILAGFIFTNLYAQPEVVWEQTYGGTGYDYGHDLIQLPDGGFIVLGSSSSADGDIPDHYGQSDILVFRLDATGEMLWIRNIGGSNSDGGKRIVSLNNGYFIIGDHSSSHDFDVEENNGSSDIWMAKMDINGGIIWSKNYGGSEADYMADMLLLPNDNIMVLAGTYSNDGDVSEGISNNDAFWLLNLDSDGNILWDKTYGGSHSEWPSDLIPANDGGFLLYGASMSYNMDLSENHGERDLCLFKVDAEGNLEAQASYGGSEDELGIHGVATTDNGFLITATTKSDDFDVANHLGSRDIWVLKLNADLQMEWQSNLGGMGNDGLQSVLITSQNTLLLTGNTTSEDAGVFASNGGFDTYIFEMDMDGNILWGENYQSGNIDKITFYNILETAPNSYTALGWIEADTDSTTRCYILKMDEQTVGIDNLSESHLAVYPNPFDEQIQLILPHSTKHARISITDASGKLMMQRQADDEQLQIATKSWVPGIYIISTQLSDGTLSRRKVVKY